MSSKKDNSKDKQRPASKMAGKSKARMATTTKVVSAVKLTPPVGPDYQHEVGSRRSTGLAFLDRMMDGGHEAGDVYNLLGTPDSCRGTISVMISVEGARQEHNQWLSNNRKGTKGQWLHLQFGPPRVPEITASAAKYAERIDWSTRNQPPQPQSVTGPDPSKICRDGGRVPAELVPEEVGTDYLNNHWMALEFPDGALTVTEHVDGLIEQLVNHIERHANKHPKVHIAGVVIDDVQAAISNCQYARGKGAPTVTGCPWCFVQGAKWRIAEHFRCPVWLLHRTTPPVKAGWGLRQLLDMTVPYQCGWPGVMSFAVSNGSHLVQLVAIDKDGNEVRRVLRVEKKMNRVVDVGNEYEVDPTSRMIVKIRDWHHPMLDWSTEPYLPQVNGARAKLSRQRR